MDREKEEKWAMLLLVEMSGNHVFSMQNCAIIPDFAQIRANAIVTGTCS
jgi:hypothetical protein